MESDESLLGKMRNKRDIGNVAYMKFAEKKGKLPKYAFAFFEGEDSKYYYSRIQNIFGNNFDIIIAGNKKSVLGAMKLIKNGRTNDNNRTMFFVDHDFDVQQDASDEELFETPCYSIENFYAQEDVVSKILVAEFGISKVDPDYTKCMDDFRRLYTEFTRLVLPFNALLFYQRRYAKQTRVCFEFNNIVNLVSVKLDAITKSAVYEEKLRQIMYDLGVDKEKFSEIQNELLQEGDPFYTFRGKVQLDFIVKFLSELKKANNAGKYFKERRQRVYLEPTVNRLGSFSQYAETPEKLIQFLERRFTRFSSEN